MVHSFSNRFTTELSDTDILSYPWQGLASTNNYTFIPGTINFINSMFSSFIHACTELALSLQLIFTNISIIVRFRLISINVLSSRQLIICNCLNRTTSQHILTAMGHPRQSLLKLTTS